MDIFRIENSVADLDKEVTERSVPSLDCPCILPSPLLDLTTHALAANDNPATTTTSLQHSYTCILLLTAARHIFHPHTALHQANMMGLPTTGSKSLPRPPMNSLP